MARAAVAAGADGLIIEVHPDPERALSDGPQSLTFDQFATLMSGLEALRPSRVSSPAAVPAASR
jgi:3-deoxy-7-phosphoheptulonate synthase